MSLSMDKYDVETSAVPSESGNFSAGEIEDVPAIDPQLEKRTLAKFDKYLLPQLFVILILAYLDRTNIGNAKVFGFEDGIGLKGTQFNTLSTIFYPTYVTLEVPWTMAVKRFGANQVLGVAMVAWSIITLGTGFIHNYHQAIAVRILLGTFEACLVPSIAFIISTIWSRESQSKRMAMIYGCQCLSGAFGGLIAYGIESMGRKHGLDSWRWLFIIEGAASVGLCAICWLLLPRSAEGAWFLSAEEKEVMRARKQRDILYKGSEEFSWSYARMAFTDPFIYVASLSFFCSSIALFGFGTFLPTIIKGLGYTSKQANYLTIPVYFFATMILCTATAVSDRLKKRAAVICFAPVPVIIGYIIVCGTDSHGAGYFAMFLIGAGIYTYNCLILTWVTNNLSPDYKRSVGMPFFVSLANISGIVASNIYPSTDGPRYLVGNAVSAGMEFLALLGIGCMWWMLKKRNNTKETLKAQGVEDNGKEGDRALDFVYNL
ncbi:MFS general substrate transporter [Xylona heveae TC161]|uniref:MFS general substrate transporter n=1 Tax=Xylona heveae (strain CBS 132557 / TC161) TaxID=1328760 RepID=A0A165GB97_XYLHT|nr:MFS general substrate transporter [Xylona heveae TC161]KZF21980.1 MFS general substrate transporter [Xylona heveae TC161]